MNREACASWEAKERRPVPPRQTCSYPVQTSRLRLPVIRLQRSCVSGTWESIPHLEVALETPATIIKRQGASGFSVWRCLISSSTQGLLAEAGLASDKNKSLGGFERSVKALLEVRRSTPLRRRRSVATSRLRPGRPGGMRNFSSQPWNDERPPDLLTVGNKCL